MNQFFCDNLQVLREHLRDESVSHIYPDSPFNSKRDYNVLFTIKGYGIDARITALKTRGLGANRRHKTR